METNAPSGKLCYGRVLVADDEEAFRKSCVVLLQRSGFEAEGVGGGAAALERLRAGSFDLLISDIRMPGNAELELLHSLAGIAPGLPIVLVTGYPTVETAMQAVQLQVVAYLLKPVDPPELMGVVQRVWEDRLACRAVQDNLNRVESWNHDLRAISDRLPPNTAESPDGLLGMFLALSLQNIAGTLSDMRHVIDFMVRTAAPSEAIRALESSHPVALTAALQDAITTIERTKGSFKSKALAELRERLELLLHGPGTVSPRQHTQSE